MFKRKVLYCSFCGKDEASVAKLVAGPNVCICDECVALAARIMQSTGSAQSQGRSHVDTLWARIRKFLADYIGVEHRGVSDARNARA